MLQISPQALIIRESVTERLYFQNADSNETLSIQLAIKPRQSGQKLPAANHPNAFILSSYQVEIPPLQQSEIQVQFIPLQKDEFETAKVLISSIEGNYEIPLLGVSGIVAAEREGDYIVNTGTCDIILKNESVVSLLKPTESLKVKKSDQPVYLPLYAQKMAAESTEIGEMAREFTDVFEFIEKVVEEVPADRIEAQFVGSEIMPNITEHESLNIPTHVNIPTKLDNDREKTRQNTTLEGEKLESNVSEFGDLPQEFHSDSSFAEQERDMQMISAQPQSRDSLQSVLSSNAPHHLKQQYEKELDELRQLESEYDSRQSGYPKDRGDLKTYIYETEVVPDFMPISVKYFENQLYYTPQNLKFLNEVPMYQQLLENTFWRLLNSEFRLETPSIPVRYERVCENATATIIYFTGELPIENTADETGFHEKIAAFYPNLTDEVAHVVENMSYLYYNIDFITTQQEYHGFRINMKTDNCLSGRISPGETRTVNITIAITVTNVEGDELPEVPQLFENLSYSAEDNKTKTTQPLYVRITGFRFDRYYTDEEFSVLPGFYEGQNDDEIREAIDVPVCFGNNVVVERKPEKSVALEDLRFPNGDLRVNVAKGKITQAFNMEMVDLMEVLPVIQLNDSIDLGKVSLRREEVKPRVLREAESKNVEKYIQQKTGVMAFSPVANLKHKPPKTPMYGAEFISNKDGESKNKFELSGGFPIIFKKKTIDFSKIDVGEIEIQCFPTNLPRCSENCEFPVLSHCFTCKKDRFKIETEGLFLSSDYLAGDIVFRCQLSENTVNDLINSVISAQRRPMYIEEQFMLEIRSTGSFEGVVDFPLLVRAEIDLDAAEFNYESIPNGRNYNIRNAIQGLNMRLVNGYVQELFAQTKVLKFQPTFYMSKANAELELFNGSGKAIVAFCQGNVSPFKCASTFSVAGHGGFSHQVEFAPKKPGNYEFEMIIRWPDTKKMKDNQENQKTENEYHQMVVRVMATAVHVPLLLKQNDEDFPKFIRVNEFEYTMLYIVNVASHNAKFEIENEDGALEISPRVGVVESGASGVVRMQWAQNVQSARVRVTGEYLGGSGVVFDGIAKKV